jgi:hypothetical protein
VTGAADASASFVGDGSAAVAGASVAGTLVGGMEAVPVTSEPQAVSRVKRMNNPKIVRKKFIINASKV